jgi:gamma-glutamyltranspeptidase/glutathione hydrolase
MTPTILEDPEGRLFMIIGAPGGATIITTVFQIITDVVDHGMNIQEAISTPRVHHQWLPDEFRYERYGLPRDVIRNLEQRGWTVNGGTSEWGRAHGITIHYALTESRNDDAGRNPYDVTRDERVYLGGVDPRGDGAAVGY